MNTSSPREGAHRLSRPAGRTALAVVAVLAGSALLPASALAAGGDLAVSTSVTPNGPVTVGQMMTFVVTVTNTSSVTSEGMSLSEVLPGNSSDPREPSAGHAKWVSQTSTSDPAFGCSGEPGPADSPPYGTTCKLDRPMAGGESFSLTIRARADVAGHAVNYAYAGSVSDEPAYDPQTGTYGPVDDDPNQSNNTAKTAFEIVKPQATCSVPKLKGKTLAEAKKLLKRAGCLLGQVRGPRPNRGRRHIVRQDPPAHRDVPAGTKVNVRLG